MSELVRMNVEIQRADNLGVRRGRPKVDRIINRAVFNHLQQTLETAFGKWFSIFHVQHIKALCAFALLYKLRKQRGRYRNIPDCGRGLEGVADGRLRVCESHPQENQRPTTSARKALRAAYRFEVPTGRKDMPASLLLRPKGAETVQR